LEVIMVKRILLLAALLALCVAPQSAGAAKSYDAERFDVEWQLTEAGVLQVTETVVFRFQGGPFTYVYRDLPNDYADGIEFIGAALDGTPLPQGTQPNQVEVERGDPIVVTWHFEPTSDATRTFQLQYRVLGVIRQEGGADLFWWNALPTDYDYTIGSATVRLSYPPALQPAGPAEVRRGQAEMTQGAGQVTWVARDLKSDTPLTVALPFPPGSLISAPPGWQARAAEIQRNAPLFAGAAAGLLGGGLAALALLWVRGRRPASAIAPAMARASTLPSRLPPAIAGALVAPGATPAAAHALATLFDLARRGLLTIEDAPKERWFKSQSFYVRLLDRAPAGLAPYEQGLLDLMFSDKKGAHQDTVKLSDLATRLQSKLKLFSEPLKAALVEGSWIDPKRQATARRFMILGIVLMLMMLPLGALGALLAAKYGAWPFLLVAVAFILGLVSLIMSGTYSPLSDEGAREAMRWQGFVAYLKDVIKGREAGWDVRLFEQYLPYATAFNAAQGWAKTFEKRGGAQIPAWFRSVNEAGDASLGSFVAMISATHTATVSASGAGGGGAGGGGGSGAG